MRKWSLQDAEDNLNAVIEAALAGEPQWVGLREEPAVVVLAAAEYERLKLLENEAVPTFGRLLLEIPQDDGAFERLMTAGPPQDDSSL